MKKKKFLRYLTSFPVDHWHHGVDIESPPFELEQKFYVPINSNDPPKVTGPRN